MEEINDSCWQSLLQTATRNQLCPPRAEKINIKEFT
jgi:hypothetical protein